MREFIYYSRTAPTAGNLIGEDLQKAGRIDIAIHVIIASFFLSHNIRADAKLHLCFAGPPNPPRHLELKPVIEGKTGIDKLYLAKKNISAILKRMLYKCKEGENKEVFPGFFIEKKGFLKVVKEMHERGRNIYILDPKGEDIRKAKIMNNPIFVMGDHKGLPLKELKRLKDMGVPVTIGPKIYFASQTVAVVNNELDRREEEGLLSKSSLNDMKLEEQNSTQ